MFVENNLERQNSVQPWFNNSPQSNDLALFYIIYLTSSVFNNLRRFSLWSMSPIPLGCLPYDLPKKPFPFSSAKEGTQCLSLV